VDLSPEDVPALDLFRRLVYRAVLLNPPVAEALLDAAQELRAEGLGEGFEARGVHL